jgi:hypothetical protein
MARPLSDLAQAPALYCRGSKIDFTGILYCQNCQNMSPRTNWANTITPSLYQPVYRDTRVCQKPAKADNITATPTCQLTQTGAFTADHTLKKVQPAAIQPLIPKLSQFAQHNAPTFFQINLVLINHIWSAGASKH